MFTGMVVRLLVVLLLSLPLPSHAAQVDAEVSARIVDAVGVQSGKLAHPDTIVDCNILYWRNATTAGAADHDRPTVVINFP